MSLSVNEFFAEARAAEEKYTKAFETKLESLSDELLAKYAAVLESHKRLIENGCLPSPFRLTDEARRQPGYFRDTSAFRVQLEGVLPTVAKHELSYLNGFGVYNALAWCARRKAKLGDANTGESEHAQYLGLSFAFHAVADEIAMARRDYFKQVLVHGTSIANSQCEAFEARHTDMYSKAYTESLETAQSEFRRFLLSETAKQQARVVVHKSGDKFARDGGDKQ